MRARAWAWWVALLAGVAGARELDPAACAPRFDVQRDKIIRTEESREMGARYLSELDVGARSECLRLCCETDACDVFVYEEKGPGSCYLFNCGPPEDFRCKFTAHSNFSSGVLALSRRLAELQDQERLAHHEQELANLRSATSSTASTSTAASSRPPRPPPPPHTTLALPEQPPSGCSRYQFACRRGGECIAVYNACDGVPQCADGSDEAPELGCPPPPPPPATRATPAPHATPPPRTVKPQREQESAEAGGDAPAEDATPERWPHRLTQAQPQHRFNDGATGSHIFSHKGGLLQEPEGNALGAQYPPFETPWSRRGWPLQQTGMEGAATAGERAWGGAYPRPQWPEPDPRRAWPVPQPDQETPAYMAPKTMPEIPVAYAGRQQTLRDGPKKGLELSAGPPPPPSAPPARPLHDRVKLDGDKTVVASGASAEPADTKRAGEGVAHRHYAADADDHDGLSERPPAAVLLLVLGVLLTAAMAAMLGCRARAARRRLRRGKSPFAHDADYLVNGMYL